MLLLSIRFPFRLSIVESRPLPPPTEEPVELAVECVARHVPQARGTVARKDRKDVTPTPELAATVAKLVSEPGVADLTVEDPPVEEGMRELFKTA